MNILDYFKSKFQHKQSEKSQVLNKSIILVGPVGVGKSLISDKYSQLSGLPVITTDMMRFCDRNIENIKKEQHIYIDEIAKLESEIINCSDQNQKEQLKAKQRDLRNKEWVCRRQIEMRKLFPNLPNYDDMGYNESVSQYLRENFGQIGWHYYQKQFENQLLTAILEQASTPCIFDMGGGMTISLDKDYAILDKKFRELNEDIYLKYFNLDQIGFQHIDRALEPFKNVISLQLPANYKSNMQKAGNDELNPLFISTGQYDNIAKYHIDTTGLIQDSTPNIEKISHILQQIQEISSSPIPDREK